MIKAYINLYGRPNERLIFIGLCKKYKVKYKYNENTGYMTYTGTPTNVTKVRDVYNAIIAIAYKRLAFCQADHKFDHIPNKTLTSEFMQAFAAITYSLTTGEQFTFRAETESQRAGIKAGGVSG